MGNCPLFYSYKKSFEKELNINKLYNNIRLIQLNLKGGKYMDYRLVVRESGFRQDFIASKIGVTPQFLCMCLNGKKKLPEKRKIMLHKLLKIN